MIAISFWKKRLFLNEYIVHTSAMVKDEHKTSVFPDSFIKEIISLMLLFFDLFVCDSSAFLIFQNVFPWH